MTLTDPTPNTKLTGWRDALAYAYVLIVICDFLVFPLLWVGVQVWTHATPISPWSPVTLQAGGFFHIAVCAVLGVHIWRQGAPQQGS